MSFSETIFLFFLALVVFGPKKLPEIARQAGKLLAELRRASNEFKSQIESEIARAEVEKRQEMLPPAKPPEGAIPSRGLNAAPATSEPATMAAPNATPPAASESTPATEASAGAESLGAPASQEFHA